jgi:hypothetical protein
MTDMRLLWFVLVSEVIERVFKATAHLQTNIHAVRKITWTAVGSSFLLALKEQSKTCATPTPTVVGPRIRGIHSTLPSSLLRQVVSCGSKEHTGVSAGRGREFDW